MLSVRLQTCPLALLLVAEDTENKFRAVRKLLVENHYEVLMVEAGAEKICKAHLNPRCWTEANWIIDDAKQAKRILNRIFELSIETYWKQSLELQNPGAHSESSFQ